MSTPAPNPATASAPAVKKPLTPGGPPEGQYTRRDTLVLLGWAWLAAAIGGWLAAALRFMFPNILYEPNPTFKAGRPKDFPLDSNGKAVLYTNWQAEKRVWIASTVDGLYAFEARCTHLGCTPRWIVERDRFECPCHGSNFNIEGDVIAGPAPKPLYRLGISVTQDGQLLVDKANRNNNPMDRKKERYFLSRNKIA